jgi:hypothetical protein
MKLDRTAFKMGNHQSSGDNKVFWASQSINERLKAAYYLNSVAFNFDINNAPKIDRTVFGMRKHE